MTTIPSQYTEAIVRRHVRELFRRLPMLSGFRLRADLTVAEVSVCCPPRGPVKRGLYPLVMGAIVELAECQPEALHHMRDRAFARNAY